jgi:arylsulfatase A-like enzyme
MRRAGLVWLLVFVAAGCARRSPGPDRLLLHRTVEGTPPHAVALAPGGESRPALMRSASFRALLPSRGLLTFGMGVAFTGSAEDAPGWFRLKVRAGDKVLLEHTLNPRAAHGWRDFSLPLEGVGREAVLAFELRLTDRDGADVAWPPGLLLGVSDPTVHDLGDYGKAKGILLVSIDTLRRDHVGAHGYGRPTTPRLDALAREGVLCADAVSSSSWTLPAHLSMLTSVDPAAHGGVDMGHAFNHRVPTLAALLRQAGFATHAVTSHLYVSAVYGLDDGFDRLDFHQDRKATDVANRAVDVLDRVGDRPFFLFLHFYDPHWHYDPPESTRKIFETPYSGSITGLLQDFSRRDPKSVTPADLAHLLALYDGEIRYVDDELGRVLDHLQARGLDRGTLVAVTSDHGEEFLEHGSWEHQKTLYDEVVRIPLMLRGPGVGPRREEAQTSLLDVAPTVLAWAGLAVPAHMQGRSLLTPRAAQEAYGETDHTVDGTRKLFLRFGEKRWKAIFSLDRDGKSVRAEEWYDLAADGAERHNVAPPPSVADPVRRLARERWETARARGTGAPPVVLSPEQRERLRALGYVGP